MIFSYHKKLYHLSNLRYNLRRFITTFRKSEGHFMSQFFYIHPETPQLRLINQAVEILRNGGVIVSQKFFHVILPEKLCLLNSDDQKISSALSFGHLPKHDRFYFVIIRSLCFDRFTKMFNVSRV